MFINLNLGNNKYHDFSDNCACQFPPAWQIFNNSHLDLFSGGCAFSYLCSKWLMSTFQYLWSSCSVQSLVIPIETMIFCWYKSYNSLRVLYLVNQLATIQQQIKSCAGFVFSKDDIWVPEPFLFLAVPIAHQIRTQVLEAIGTVGLWD